MSEQVPEDLPKLVRGEPLETEDGVEVPAQQNLGSEELEGGGEWPYPGSPPREPAPGAVDEAGAEEEAAPGT